LVAAANAKGGRDNITVVLVRIDDPRHTRLAS
jgi:serine/threonine protein phosphatase PrpC